MSTPSEDQQKIRGIAADLRIIADDIVRGAGRAEDRIAELLEHNRELATALEAANEQVKSDQEIIKALDAKLAARPVAHTAPIPDYVTRAQLIAAIRTASESADAGVRHALHRVIAGLEVP